LILQRQIEQRGERRKCLDADIRLSCQKPGLGACRPVEHPGRDFKPPICLRPIKRPVEDDKTTLVEGTMNANAATKPGMMPIKDLAKNCPVGVLKPRCIIAAAHIRALTAARRIKPTSPHCRSARQPNPGKRSTYRRGNFKNAGREWRPKGTPEEANVHDFIDPKLKRAVPYGIYDINNNTGWISVGTDHDTAAFAVNAIRRWWKAMGKKRYPKPKGLLVTADGGGSSGYRVLENRATETG
jgi:hypothetical protein